MRNYTAILIVLLLAAGASFGQGAPKPSWLKEKVSLVKVEGFDGVTFYEVMKKDDYTALRKRIVLEGRAWSKALRAAENAWRAQEGYERKRFPNGAISPRRAKIIGRPYTDREKADEKAFEYMERLREDELREEEKLVERSLLLLDRRIRGVRDPVARRRMQEDHKRREEEAKIRQQENEMEADNAREMFQAELDKLLGTAPARAPEPEPEPAPAAAH